jgi:hypothetical protein
MTLWGLGLGLGTAYGTLVGIPLFPIILFFGPPSGAMYGTMAGLPRELLEGAFLGAMTVVWRLAGTPSDLVRYRRAAGLACSTVCMVTLALTFELTARSSGTSLVGGKAYDSGDMVGALIFLVVPSTLATGAAWLVARRVAGQYMSEFHA